MTDAAPSRLRLMMTGGTLFLSMAILLCNLFTLRVIMKIAPWRRWEATG